MKFKNLVLAALFSSFTLAQAHAVPAAKEVKSAPVQQEDAALKTFNSSVGVRLAAFGKAKVQDKDVLVFAHALTNKGKKASIKAAKWTTVLVLNNQIVLQVPAQIDKLNLKPGQTTQVNVIVPVEGIPQAALPVVTDPKNQFQQVIVAQELTYTNGKRVVVK